MYTRGELIQIIIEATKNTWGSAPLPRGSSHADNEAYVRALKKIKAKQHQAAAIRLKKKLRLKSLGII